MSSRQRTRSHVLLAVVMASSLQGCRMPGAFPPLRTIEPASQQPRTQAHLTPDEEALLDEACCALDSGESAALSSRFPSSRSALILEELLRRQMARKKTETPLPASSASTGAPQPPPSPPPSTPRDAPGGRRVFLEARLLIEKGEMEDACARLEDALALDPGNAEYQTALVSASKQLGLELYGKGDYRRACVFWRRVLEIRPDDEEARRFLRRAGRVIENR
jgi:tetratricopeptide (TPR) repeat protein